MIPLGLYTVGMHHQDTSRHPWVRDFTNSWDTCSQRAVVAPEAFRPAVVQEAHRNVAYSGRCNLPFGWAKLYDGAGRSARLGQGLIHQLQRGCRPGAGLRAKNGDSFPSSFFGERTMSQTIDNDCAKNSRRLDDLPRITADFLTFNGYTDSTTFENR